MDLPKNFLGNKAYRNVSNVIEDYKQKGSSFLAQTPLLQKYCNLEKRLDWSTPAEEQDRGL